VKIAVREPASSARSAQNCRVERIPRDGDIRVLIVDDEPGIVKTLRAYLEADGYVVSATGRGDEVEESVRRFGPDVVILDVMLPGVDGLEVLRRLRQASDVLVLMLSAKGDEADRLVGLRMGADDYVVKPFSPREVVARVATLLRRHQPQSGHGDAMSISAAVWRSTPDAGR